MRPFLNDILRNIAAPYDPGRRDNPVGQGYWIQAEFGSGKSHLLSFLAAIALGDKEAWQIIAEKEKKAERGRRESIYRFWEEGIESKSSEKKKGLFVIVRTLVGAGGGTIGLMDKGQRLSEYILDAAKEQLQIELGRNISLYPTELLADRFISEDMERYRNDLKKFLKDPDFFDDDEFEDIDDFIRDIQQNKSPEYKRSCGNKLWRFYTEYLKVQPQIAAETENILRHMVETILNEGYSGILLVLDEVSLFMKNREEDQRTDDEKTLVVLANRLAKVHNLPIWTVCAAQQAIESKMGVKNIIADDRLKLVRLLEEDKDYYDIVLSRVREIVDPTAIGNYYLYYKRGFSWPNTIGEEEFRYFFPFHKPALEVLRSITYELTTTRSAIHFMHQTLKHQIKNKGRELIRLWELFDEALSYEEDPSGVHASIVAIKTSREMEYRAYEACKRQIDSLTKGYLKVYRDKGIMIIQTLFLYHIARTRQQGITPEEIANSVLAERSPDSNVDENIQHYETLAENLKKELRQIALSYDEDNHPRYRFDPVFTGVNPREEFQKARDEAETNEIMVQEAWEHLLALGEWPIRTRQMTIDLSGGLQSIFRDIAPYTAPWEERSLIKDKDQILGVNWQGRQISGLVGMRDLNRIANDNLLLPAINSDQTDRDFAAFISTKPVSQASVEKLLAQRRDPRVLIWTPDELNRQERDRLLDLAAYRKLIEDWQGKDTEDAVAVVGWVSNTLQTDLARIKKIVDSSYERGRIDAPNNTAMEFHVAGELSGILSPLVDRVLSSTYESRDIKFEPPFLFRREEAVKVINGIVKTGSIPKGAKPNQNISAAQNFGFGLMIMKKSAERQLDASDNPYVSGIWEFIDDKLGDEGQTMKIETLYKNFMGVGGPKDYGLTRRMVLLFLLCLVREGKVRLNVGARSGLPGSVLDYSNLADVDFSAKVLDSITEVQKVAKPENWDVLRSYAEKMLEEDISTTIDDAEISKYRAGIRELFAKERDEASRCVSKAQNLFAAVKSPNPYENELAQIARLFSSTIEAGNDIDLVLYALKEALDYQAFDSGMASQQDIDDLANRLKNYRDMKGFLEYESDVMVAVAYCNHEVPDGANFKTICQAQQGMSSRLSDLKPFIDSEVKLKTELIENLGTLIKEYTAVYATLHESVIGKADSCKRKIRNISSSDDFQAFKVMEGITALHPSISGKIEEECDALVEQIFSCSSPSRASIEEYLKRSPIHDCGLSFENYGDHIDQAEDAVTQARKSLESSINVKLSVFLTPTVRDLLGQGKSEKIIADILDCRNTDEVRSVLIQACLRDDSVVSIINRYLKRVVVKKVKIADFRPSVSTIEKSQIPDLVQEFSDYLEHAIEEIEDKGDSLPMLQIE